MCNPDQGLPEPRALSHAHFAAVGGAVAVAPFRLFAAVAAAGVVSHPFADHLVKGEF